MTLKNSSPGLFLALAVTPPVLLSLVYVPSEIGILCIEAPPEYLHQPWPLQLLWALAGVLTAGLLDDLAPRACGVELSVTLTVLSWLSVLTGGILSRAAFNKKRRDKEQAEIEKRREIARENIKKEIQEE